MTKDKQIEELEKLIVKVFADDYNQGCDPDAENTAKAIYEAGWRKQREGKWKFHKDGSGTCSECHFTQMNVWDYDNWQNFCDHCGAKMKGE